MKARQCWTVLANKAEDQCSRIQQELTNLQQRLEGLQANERRLRQLYAEAADETLAQLGLTPNRAAGVRGMPLRLAA